MNLIIYFLSKIFHFTHFKMQFCFANLKDIWTLITSSWFWLQIIFNLVLNAEIGANIFKPTFYFVYISYRTSFTFFFYSTLYSFSWVQKLKIVKSSISDISKECFKETHKCLLMSLACHKKNYLICVEFSNFWNIT